MRISKLLMFLVVFSSVTFFSIEVKAQEIENAEPSSFSVSSDVVSSFIWRGMVASPVLNFQPSVNFDFNNFSIGAWGSGDIIAAYKEIDMYLAYSISGFSVSLTDYYWNTNKKYFNLTNEFTGHNLEFGLSYVNEKFPLQILVGTLFWGEDKKINFDLSETDATKQNYSTYIELSYTFDLGQNQLNVFAGATPFTGLYGNGFNVVYTGFTASKDIVITEKFTLPMFATFSFNPQTEDFNAVVGISF